MLEPATSIPLFGIYKSQCLQQLYWTTFTSARNYEVKLSLELEGCIDWILRQSDDGNTNGSYSSSNNFMIANEYHVENERKLCEKPSY